MKSILSVVGRMIEATRVNAEGQGGQKGRSSASNSIDEGQSRFRMEVNTDDGRDVRF